MQAIGNVLANRLFEGELENGGLSLLRSTKVPASAPFEDKRKYIWRKYVAKEFVANDVQLAVGQPVFMNLFVWEYTQSHTHCRVHFWVPCVRARMKNAVWRRRYCANF
jgi:hypothetical protein